MDHEAQRGLPALTRSPLARDVAWIAVAALVYAVSIRLGLSQVWRPERVAPLWAGPGIFLAAVLLARRGLRPFVVGALAIIDLAAGMLAGKSFLASLVCGLSLAADAVLSTWLLLRHSGGTVGFRKVREVTGFLVLAVVLSSVLVAPASAATRPVPGFAFWGSWMWWLAAAGIGKLLVTPFFLCWAPWATDRARSWSTRRVLEATALFIPLALVNASLLFYRPQFDLFSATLPYLTLTLLLWTAMRLGTRGVTSALLVLGVIDVLVVASGNLPGLYFSGAVVGDAIAGELYLLLMAVPSLVLAAVATEREEARETIRERGAHLDEVEGIAHLGSWELDVTSGRRIWSDEIYRILGMEPQASEATYEGFIEAVHPDDRPAVHAIYFDALREGKDNFEIEHRVVRKGSGEVRHVYERCEHLRDAGGEVTRSVGIMQDVTERRKAQEEREKLQEQLIAAQKMEAVGRLAGGVAHDFNNMLGVILGHTDLALLQGGISEKARAHLTEIRTASERSARLTQQLLAFARRQTIAPRVLDLNESVAGLLKMLRRLLGEDVDLAWVPGGNLCKVKMDPSQLDQILANLCVNARDAIPGVGKITIETKNVTFDESSSAGRPDLTPGQFVMLRVSDNGTGMGEDVLEHLFEPFFTTKGVGKGTGLGLATVYGIVKQNNGFIEVQSAPGVGTTFEIYIPSCAGQTTERGVPAGPQSPRGSGETVLLVEDEAAILDLGKVMLEGMGYTVLGADTPDRAIRLAETHAGAIHLLITDVVLPGMDGKDLAERLRRARPGIKCLFMSGYTSDVIAPRGVLEEGVHFIQKPFSTEELAAKVRSALAPQEIGNFR